MKLKISAIKSARPAVSRGIINGLTALSIAASPMVLSPSKALAAGSGPYSMNLEYKDVSKEAEKNFIANLKEAYLTPEVKRKAVIGLEIEMNKLSPQRIVEILKDLYGGSIAAQGDQLLLSNSSLGNIRVYRDGDMWLYNDWVNQQNGGRESLMRKIWYSVRSALRESVEVVFEPLPYDKVLEVEKAMAGWAKAGAAGSVGLSGAATQVSLTNDPKNTGKLKNLLANYTNNAKAFRRYFNPVIVRRMNSNLPLPSQSFRAKLADYSYQPVPGDFWVDFKNGAHVKFSRMNIGPALLANLDVDAESKRQLQAEGWSHGNRTELREANAVILPGVLTELVDTALAIDAAAERTGTLNPVDLQTTVESQRISKGLRVARAGEVELDKAPFSHTLSQTLRDQNYVNVNRFAPEAHVQMSFLDEGLLKKYGLVNANRSLAELKSSFTARFGFEYVRPEEEVGQKGKETPVRTTERIDDENKLMALAYDDGYLGRGDGRATWITEYDVPGIGVLDVGDKGGGPTTFVIPQESIDAGFHVAEKDGLLSLHEAAVVALQSKSLAAFGIDSEQIIGFIETGKETGKNLKPPVIEPTAKVLRMFENGLRGAHLRKYNADEMRRVALWLRSREAVRLGRDRNDVPPTDVYLENKVKRDAIRAALAQHFWVVHGAINPANLYENGWADIYYSDVLRRPDGHFTHMNVYARFENQMNEFFKVTDQFARAILSTDPSAKIDHRKIFWDEYNNELTRLELIGLGLTDADARSLMERDPALAKRYKDLVWDINYNHLETNSRVLRAEVMAALRDRQLKPSAGALDLSALVKRSRNADSFGEREEVADHEMFRKDRIIFGIKERVKKLLGMEQNQVSEVTTAKAGRLLEIAEQIFATVGRGTVGLQAAVERTRRITEIRIPNRADDELVYEDYMKSGSKDFNAFAAPTIERIDKTAADLREIYGELSTASRNYRGKVRGVPPVARAVRAEEFAATAGLKSAAQVAEISRARESAMGPVRCEVIFKTAN